MLHEQVDDIRSLFKTDTETQKAFVRIPTHKDISTALVNTLRYSRGELHTLRTRSRLGLVMTNAKQVVIGYAGISLVRNAAPTKHEHERVWGKMRHDNVSGLFIRQMIVHVNERCQGYGSMLLDAILVQTRGTGLTVYGDVSASNMRMRKFLHEGGFHPNIFWHTKTGALMVRYRFR